MRKVRHACGLNKIGHIKKLKVLQRWTLSFYSIQIKNSWSMKIVVLESILTIGCIYERYSWFNKTKNPCSDASSHSLPAHPFSIPWKHQGVEKGCIGKKWVNTKTYTMEDQSAECTLRSTIKTTEILIQEVYIVNIKGN